MKYKIIMILLFMTSTLNTSAQTANIHLKNGRVVIYKSSDVDYIDFTEKNNSGEDQSLNNHEFVDLGLTSGLLWATCNIGATKPEEYGNFYAWGETESKNSFSWSNYAHCEGTQESCYKLGDDISETEYDVAHVKWGGAWRLPSNNDFKELYKECTWKWETINGVSGFSIVGPSGGSIFIPAAGWQKGNSEPSDVGSHGYYWSSNQKRIGYDWAYTLTFGSSSVGTNNLSPCAYGQSVRPVAKLKSN